MLRAYCSPTVAITATMLPTLSWAALPGYKYRCHSFVFRLYQVSEMAVSELPGNPNAVWTVRKHVEGKKLR